MLHICISNDPLLVTFVIFIVYCFSLFLIFSPCYVFSVQFFWYKEKGAEVLHTEKVLTFGDPGIQHPYTRESKRTKEIGNINLNIRIIILSIRSLFLMAQADKKIKSLLSFIILLSVSTIACIGRRLEALASPSLFLTEAFV